MFITDKYIQLLSKPVAEGGLGYKPSSIETVNYNISKIFFDAFVATGKWKPYENTPEGKRHFNKTAKLVPGMLNQTEAVMNAVMAQPEKQRSMYLYIIKFIYDKMPKNKAEVVKFYQTEFDKANTEHKKLITLPASNEKEMKNTITDEQYDTVLAKYNEKAELSSATPAILIRRLILALYKYIKPLRPQDYVNTSFTKGTTPNYIDLDKNELIITDGKTNNADNTRTIKIPEPLIKIIRFTKAKLNTNWLIPMASDSDRKMERTAFTHFFQKTFKDEGLPANIGATRLRNMAVSKEVDSGASAEEIKQSAADMGHTVGTHLLVYPKESQRLHGKTNKTSDADIIEGQKLIIQSERAENAVLLRENTTLRRDNEKMKKMFKELLAND